MHWTTRVASKDLDLKRGGASTADEEWLQRLGANILQVMKKQGYNSPYDFWIQVAGDEISRATLNYIVSGKTDPKATTLRALARLLKVKPSSLIDID